MYKDSKSMTKRLTKAVAVLLLIMIALVGTIVGLTAHVVEEAKETKTDSSGITKVKGTDQPTAAGSVVTQALLTESFASSADELDAVKSLRLESQDGSEEFSYTITGWSRNAAAVKFYASRGDVVTVDKDGSLLVTNAAGGEILNVPNTQDGRRRHILGRRASFLSTSAAFTLTSGGLNRYDNDR